MAPRAGVVAIGPTPPGFRISWVPFHPVRPKKMNRIPLLTLAFLLLPPAFMVAQTPIADAKKAVSAEVLKFEEHVVTLSNPFFEGRVPGSNGMEVAKDYMEFWFKQYGLIPSFADANGTANSSWRQPFPMGGKVQVTAEAMQVGNRKLIAAKDFLALPIGGSGTVDAPLVFCGYGIRTGPDGFSNLPEDVDLGGKIAVVFSHEPMNDAGKSKWATARRDWSRRRLTRFKASALGRVGAKGLIVIPAPGVADPEAATLDRGRATRVRADAIPVMHVTAAVGGELLANAGQSPMDLRKMADAGTAMLPLQTKASISATVELERTMAENVAGTIPGRGALKDEIVIIGAHLDHLGMGYFGSREGSGKLHPGADDNATGAAAVIMLAERLVKHYASLPADQPARSIVCVAWSAEESGLNGSRFYVNNPIGKIEDHALCINFDMIGRVEGKRLKFAGTTSGTGMEAWLAPIIEGCPLELQTSSRMSGGSDHMSFMQKRVPYLFSINDLHADYHTSRDTSNKINCADGVEVIDLYEKVGKTIATLPEKPKWVGRARR